MPTNWVCPARQELQRLLLGDLPANEAEALEAHLTRCAPCLATVRVLLEQDTLVGMGCYMETAKATVDYLRRKGIAAGCPTVFVFRPFSARRIVEALKHSKRKGLHAARAVSHREVAGPGVRSTATLTPPAGAG
jgi:hypothetical protein